MVVSFGVLTRMLEACALLPFSPFVLAAFVENELWFLTVSGYYLPLLG